MTYASTLPGLLLAFTLGAAAAVGCGSSTTSSTTTGGTTTTSTTGATGGGGAGGGDTTSTTTSGSTGGGGAGGGACVPGKSVTFSGDVYPILQQSCSGFEGCHHLLLQSPAGAISWLVNQPSAQCDGRTLVAPGHPEGSYLIDKLRDQNLCPDTVPMPKSGLAGPWQPLPEEQIQTFADWICAGAKSD
jgi:hypothetical protein